MGFKCIRQTDLQSCGPTSALMLCHHYGMPTTIEYVSEAIGLTNIGASVRDVSDGLQELGFDTVVVKCTPEKLQKLPLPAILFWRNNHFVVLYRCSGNRFHVADPASGKVKFTPEEFKVNWCGDNDEGTVILALPSAEFGTKEYPRPENSWIDVVKDVCRNTVSNRMKVLLILLLTLLSSVCSWYIPLIYKNLIDEGVMKGDLRMIMILFAAQLSFFVGNLLFTNINSIILLKINSRVAVSYLGNLLKKIIRLPLRFFDSTLDTEMIQRFEDFNRLQGFISNTLISQFFSLVSLIVFSCLLAFYNVWAVVIFYLVSAVAITVNLHYLRERKYLDYTRFAQKSRNYNNILEMLKGMRDIKICGAESFHVGKWEETQQQINDLTVRSSILEFKQSSWFSTINKFRDICIITFCALLAASGDFSIGVLISVTYLLGMMSAPMNALSGFFKGLQDARISAERISALQTKDDERSGDAAPEFNREITLDNVSFKYPGRHSPMVLDSISMSIPRGKVTAIVGHSGCGKTTLMKILLGFYPLAGGEIKVDGRPLPELDINRWRRMAGTVFQDGHIFSGSIAENIAMTKDYDADKLREVSRLARVDDFASRLPLGYGTPIGASGQDLSQGQKQRILIARALYADPEILFFDEATSALDSANENGIMENIYSACGRKTVIVIAHRLSTVRMADQIVVMESGRIAETGTHQELIALKGKYHALVRNQIDTGE